MNNPLLAAIAANGLKGAPRFESVSVSADELSRLLDASKRHRLIGLIASAVTDGILEVDDESLDRVAAEQESWIAHVLRVEQLLIDVAEVFSQRSIEFRLFKGPALAHSVYPDPGHRLFADIDLVVPSRYFGQATVAVEAEFGGVRALPELRAGFDREFGKENLVRVGKIEVDLHRTIAAGPIGLAIPLDQLFADSDESVEIGGVAFPLLPPIAHFVQVCVNAAIGDYPTRLLSLRDVAAMWETHDLDPRAVAAMAERWRATAAVKLAIETTRQTLDLGPNDLSRWAAAAKPALLDRVLLRSYLTPARSYTRPAASVLVIPGLNAKLRYLRAIVSPQPGYLQARGWSRRSHGRRALSGLRRRQ